MTWRHWFKRRECIYSNYPLYKIPYVYIDGFDKLDLMRQGFVAMDELWLICDARTSRATKNRIVSNILSKSRKRGLTIAFTAQVMSSIDTRVRKICDFLSYPILNPDETIVKAAIFRGGKARTGSYMKTIYFLAPVIMSCYDTNFEVNMEEESKTPMLFTFQESKESEPEFFEKWEDADKRGEEYWTKNKILLKGIM